MTRGPLFLVQLLALYVAAGAMAQPAPATQPSRSALGMNSNALNDWDSSVVLIDEVKAGRVFGSPTSPSATELPDAPDLDPNGWPLGDFGFYLVTGRTAWPGVHKVRCGGKVDSIKLHASAGAVQGYAYDAAANVTTADVVVPEGSNQLALKFTGTQRNPADPAAGKGVTWLQVLCPSYSAITSTSTDSGYFTKQYLTALAPFGHLRLMALNQTNSHPISSWADRAKVMDAQYSSKRGVPWEVQIELCRRAGVAPWICVPHAADDDYVIALAGLFRDGLPAGTPVYLEDSNEVWNATLGTQYGVNKSAAEAEVNGGDPNSYALPVTYWNPKTGKDETVTGGRDLWLWFRHARRSWHLTKIFRDVFGDQAYRVRGVLGVQNSDDWRSSVTLGYVASRIGPPADLFFATATAPYVGAADTVLLKNPDATADQIADYFKRECLASFTAPDGKPARHKKLADHWNLRLVAYESGGDLGQYNAALPAKSAAMNDPRVGEGYNVYLSAAFDRGGVTMFTPWLCGRYGRWGYFADTPDIRNLSTPRYAAAAAVAGRYTLADPVRPDPRDTLIKKLQADNAALAVDGAAAKAEAAKLSGKVDRARHELDN